MKILFNSLLDFIFRKKCYFCGSSKYSLKMCPKCYEKLEFLDRNANRIINGVNIFCAGVYTKELQKLIRGLKYHKQRDLAFFQANFMYEYFQALSIEPADFELVPIPLHEKRIKQRKYNHMELVCEEFSKLSGFPCNFELIKRVKDTKPQYNLSRTQRLENLNGAFEVDITKINDKTILLMDDICTSGTTFEEAIRAFNKAGINNIVCFATSTP